MKLSSRVRTLVVPYVVWNCMGLLLLLVIQTAHGNVSMSGENLIRSYTLIDFLGQMYPHPVQFQFWFLLDLAVYCIASPLLYLLIKRTGVVVPLLFTLLYFSRICRVHPDVRETFAWYNALVLVTAPHCDLHCDVLSSFVEVSCVEVSRCCRSAEMLPTPENISNFASILSVSVKKLSGENVDYECNRLVRNSKYLSQESLKKLNDLVELFRQAEHGKKKQ